MDNSVEWLTINDAAKLVDYHPVRLRELVRAGKIEARKFGPVWAVNRESLLNFVRSQAEHGEKRGPKKKQ